MSSTGPGARPRDFRVGRRLADNARSLLEGSADRPEPVAPRLASTVLLVRDGAPQIDSPESPRESGGGSGDVEVFMIRRVPSMEFAPSMWVFPGGGVDPRDGQPGLPWTGPSPMVWADRLEVDQDTAQQLVIAAVREVFEECGVLLAGPDADTVVADVTGADWAAEREALLAKEQSFGELLVRRGLVLRSDLLTFCDHWVTPPFEPRRYDTYFFTALLPQGQVADDATSEADQVAWVRPGDLLARVASGEARMLPPTVVNVERVGRAASGAEFVGRQTPVVRKMPEPVVDGEDVVLRVQLPDDD